jgi:CheY-like chemotaxis protein
MEGVEVLEAENAPVGIEIAAREKPRPASDGYPECAEMDGLPQPSLAPEPRTAPFPLWPLRHRLAEKDRSKTLEAGCDGHIPKPIDPSIFGQQLAGFLKEKADSTQ